MDNFKKIGKKIVDFLGVFIPNITFLVIFLTFMVTIVSRYFFKTPVTWSYEVSVLGYMWTMFFGVGKAMEADEHVVFGLVYDAVKPRTQFIFKVVYNTFFNFFGNLLCTVFPVHGWKENGDRSSEASIYSCFCTIYVYAG